MKHQATDTQLPERRAPEDLGNNLCRFQLIDVRAPIEFDKGHWPGALNLPLMNDEERHKVGLCYKQQGQKTAVALGHKLVSGAVKDERVQRWLEAGQGDPQQTLIYCARGGMRSQISQQWLAEAGLSLPLISGGYKALRQFLLNQLNYFIDQADLLVVAGRTGSGKTRVIEQVRNALDLEATANHRGSAFGRRTTPQPTQANFENQLAFDSLSLDLNSTVIVEDESRSIGSVHLPEALTQRIQTTAVVTLEVPLEQRVEFIIDDYVHALQCEYRRAFGEAAFDRYQAYIEGGLNRIKKRLGGVLYQAVLNDFQMAMQRQRSQDDSSGHRLWVRRLLTDYYDQMYDHQLAKAHRPVRFSGDLTAVIDYLSDASQTTTE